MGSGGLALSFALAYNVAAVAAVVVLCRHSPGFDWRALVTTWLRLLAAALAMAVVVYGWCAAGLGVDVGSHHRRWRGGGAVRPGADHDAEGSGIAEPFARFPGLRRFAPTAEPQFEQRPQRPGVP